MSAEVQSIPPSFDSGSYWEARYASGGNSGAGSFRDLAAYKANFINHFIEFNKIATALELGCGDGNQLSLLNHSTYTGVDVSHTALGMCRTKFADRPDWRFAHALDRPAYAEARYDITLSLDVIFHLTEDEVFAAYMTDLFGLSSRFVIIYSSDWDEVLSALHVRHRWFSAWVAENQPDWTLTKRHKTPFPEDPRRPAETTFAEFHVFERREQRAISSEVCR
jgi:hypothetical protein